MFNRISVLIPTRGRVGRLQTLLESFIATVHDKNAELVFKVDQDDRPTIEFLMQQRGPYLLVIGPRGAGYQDMPTFFNQLARSATGDVLMCGNDDMVFRTENWPTLLLRAANNFPDGLFDLGVTTLNWANYPFATVSKTAVECMGSLWDSRIFWGDIFLRDVMEHFGRCVYLPNVHIEHDWAGFQPDQVYLEQLLPGETLKDISRRQPDYWNVHQTAVKEAVEKLRGLYKEGELG